MIMDMGNLLESLGIPTDDLDIVMDHKYPFPDYELEVIWREWRWNNEGTQRLDDTMRQGITVNPFDHTDANGYLNTASLYGKAVEVIRSVVENDNRTGRIEVRV